MRRPWRWCGLLAAGLIGLGAGVAARAADELGPPADAAGDRETDQEAARDAAARRALTGFWTAVITLDSQRAREAVAFPLTLLDPAETGEEGPKDARYVLDAADWDALTADWPRQPLPEDEASVRLTQVRLEWFGDSCLATYSLRAESADHEFDGRYLALLVWNDGWKVAVTSLPFE